MDDKKTLDEVLNRLSLIARKGPIPTVKSGANGVGLTLLNELGIKNSSSTKARYKNVVIKASRSTRAARSSRVNLFAKVPDWSCSECKSSQEIVSKYGYETDDGRRLYCTINALRPNAQGLQFFVDKPNDLLREYYCKEGSKKPVATWRIKTLRERLKGSHPASVWSLAESTMKDGIEYFHYRYCLYTGPVRDEELAMLIEAGTVTMDHLIKLKEKKTTEKGPLFKIHPSNFNLLFPPKVKYDLLGV